MSSAPEKTQTIELWPGMVAEVMTPENRLIYVGRIEKIRSGGVYIQESTGDVLPMALMNKPVKVRFYRESDNIVLLGTVSGCTETMWKIDQLETAYIQEKRGYFRQNISIDVEAKCGALPAGGDKPKELFPCKVLDISVGGLLISCAADFHEGGLLLVTDVPLKAGTPPYTFRCTVRRAVEWTQGEKRYGCQFERLSDKEQDRLLQAIFAVQREELRRRRRNR